MNPLRWSCERALKNLHRSLSTCVLIAFAQNAISKPAILREIERFLL
jgi:hypothetical protein